MKLTHTQTGSVGWRSYTSANMFRNGKSYEVMLSEYSEDYQIDGLKYSLYVWAVGGSRKIGFRAKAKAEIMNAMIAIHAENGGAIQ